MNRPMRTMMNRVSETLDKEKTYGIDVWADATYFLYDKATGKPHVYEDGEVIVYRKSGYIQHTKTDGIKIDELENVLYRGRRRMPLTVPTIAVPYRGADEGE